MRFDCWNVIPLNDPHEGARKSREGPPGQPQRSHRQTLQVRRAAGVAAGSAAHARPRGERNKRNAEGEENGEKLDTPDGKRINKKEKNGAAVSMAHIYVSLGLIRPEESNSLQHYFPGAKCACKTV